VAGWTIRTKSTNARVVEENSELDTECIHDVTSNTDFIPDVDSNFFSSCEASYEKKGDERDR
jgi:hypothetical protein